MASNDEGIEELRRELSSLRGREKELKAEVGSLANIVPLEELRTTVARLEQEQMACRERLLKLHSEADNTTVSISPQEMDRVEREWKTWQKHCLVRKRIFFDLWSKCTEVLPYDMTKEEFQVWRPLSCGIS
jgi:predicted nuclease with TOPRIM domain